MAENELTEVRLHTEPMSLPVASPIYTDDSVQITIRSGEIVRPMTVSKLELVQQVKARLPDLDVGVQTSGAQLLLDDKPLPDTATMGDCGVQHNSELVLAPGVGESIPVGVPIGAPAVADTSGALHVADDGADPVSQKLSPCSWAFIIMVMILISWAILASQYYLLFGLFAIVFCPSLFLIKWWHANRVVTSLDQLVKKYMAGFLCAFPFLVFALMYLSFFVRLARTPGGVLLAAFFFALFIIALPEEYLKYFFTVRNYASVAQRAKADLIYATGAAMGFATGEALFLMWQMTIHRMELELDDGHLVRLVVMAVFFLVPLHCLTGYQIGLRLTIRDYFAQHPDPERGPTEFEAKVSGILCVPVTLKTLLVMFWLFFEILDSDYAWIGGVVANFILCVICLVITKRLERRLPRDYLRRVGYLNVMGYGVLPDA